MRHIEAIYAAGAVENMMAQLNGTHSWKRGMSLIHRTASERERTAVVRARGAGGSRHTGLR